MAENDAFKPSDADGSRQATNAPATNSAAPVSTPGTVSGPGPSQRLLGYSMSHDSLMLQRLVDGALPSHTAAAVKRSLDDRPAAAAECAAIADLHNLLGKATKPLSADRHRSQMLAIVNRLPDRAPQPHAKVRVLDMVLAAGIFALLISTSVIMHSTVERSPTHLIIAIACLVVGLGVMGLTSMLQRASGIGLRRAVRTPISLGPTHVLAYRAVGLALVIGGGYYLF